MSDVGMFVDLLSRQTTGASVSKPTTTGCCEDAASASSCEPHAADCCGCVAYSSCPPNCSRPSSYCRRAGCGGCRCCAPGALLLQLLLLLRRLVLAPGARPLPPALPPPLRCCSCMVMVVLQQRRLLIRLLLLLLLLCSGRPIVRCILLLWFVWLQLASPWFMTKQLLRACWLLKRASSGRAGSHTSRHQHDHASLKAGRAHKQVSVAVKEHSIQQLAQMADWGPAARACKC